MSTNFSYGPPADAFPHQRLQPYQDTPGIPVLGFTQQLSVDVIQLSFDPRTPQHTIQYLRELASKATELADALEVATGGGAR